MQVLKQSTSASTLVGPILDSTGASYTGAVIGDLNLTKNGTTAAMAAAATLTHDHNGYYVLAFTTGNTDTLGRLQVSCNKATYAMRLEEFTVLAATMFDNLVTNGIIAATTSGRTIVTDTSGLVDANAVKVGPTGSGTAQTAGDIVGITGALNTAASSGDPGTTTTLVAYLKQLVNTLEGSAGIPTFPSAAVAANAVSLAEVIRSIDTRLPSALGANSNLKADVRDLLGTAWLTPGTAGTPDVNVKLAGGTAWASGSLTSGVFAAGAITATAIADAAIDRATFAADTGLQSARSNTAAAGAAGTITLDASASATDDFYKGMVVYLTGGTGVGQARLITGYTGSTQVATVTPNWTTNPGATSTFAILPWGYVLGLSGITFPTNFSAFSIDASGRTDLGKWIGVAPLALSSQQVQAIVPDTQKVDLNTIKTQAVTCSGGVTVPAATLASTTNITSATGIDVTKVAGTTVATASAGYFPADVRQYGGSAGTFSGGRPEVNTTHIAGVVWASTTLFTLASHDPGATIGTSTLTQTQVTGGAYSVQSASCVLGDARIANLDAAVSTRMASYTQPTGFLAATFPSGTIANTTNITAGTITTVNSLAANAITRSALALDSALKTTVDGTIASATSTTAVLDSNASSTDRLYDGSWLHIYSGTGAGQCRLIVQYTGSTKTCSIAGKAWAVNPSTDSLYSIIPAAGVWGFVSAFSGSIAAVSFLADAIDANALAASAVTEIQSGLSTLDAAGVRTAVGLASANLDTQLGASGTIGTVTTHLATALELNAGSYRFTVAALANAPGGSGSDPWSTALPASYASGTAGYIVGNLSESTGSGARTVTITVNDGSAVLESARVRMVKGALNYTGTTNASGVVVFNLDDGTWTVSITLAGYSFTGTTLVVSATTSHTYSMTAVALTASSPGFTTGFTTVYDENGVAEADVDVTCVAVGVPSGGTGALLDSAPRTETSDANGLVQFTNLVKGAAYLFGRGGTEKRLVIPASAGSTYELPDWVGAS